MRSLSDDFIAELEANVKTTVLFFQGDFETGTVYLWSGIDQIEWGGNTWVGFGGVLTGISRIRETSDIKAEGISITLSGISEEVRSLILSEVRQGKTGTIFAGFLKDDGSVVADPSIAFDGRLDVPSQVDTGEEITISLAYENRLRDLQRSREYRYTNQSQQVIHPGDVGFEFVPSLQDWNGTWGKS